jgi:ribosomal protein L32
MSAARHEECPNCGATFRRGRLACPECGSDAATGWKSEADIDYESVEIPDFYEEPAPPRRARRITFVVAACLALVAMAVFALWR